VVNVERFNAFQTAELISEAAVKAKLKRNKFASLVKNKIEKNRY